jgi:hypothetical protein
VVTVVKPVSAGSAQVGDVLSAPSASIGGTGSGFTFTVTAVGSDSYNGLSATFTGGVNGPFATIQHLLFVIANNFDTAGFNISWFAAAGSYVGAGYASTVGGGTIQGYGAGSSLTTINNGPADGVYNFGECLGVEVPVTSTLAINGVTFSDAAGNGCLGFGVVGTNFNIGDILTGNPTDIVYTIGTSTSTGSGYISIEADCSVTTAPGSVEIVQTGVILGQGWLVEFGAFVNGANVTLSGSANTHEQGFAYAVYGGLILESGPPTYSGSAIGPRFGAQFGGQIGASDNPGGLGQTFYPGSTPGHVDPTSGYDYNNFVQPNTQTASYQIGINDAGQVVEMNAAGANNLTIPASGTTPFPVNTRIDIVQLGAGTTTIVAAGGVTLLSAGGKVNIAGQYSGATIYQRAIDTWVLIGELA